jgi:hypothetical protein
MTRDRALRKVLACLRLAGSSNPHESAAALRQARALMAEYGLTESDALASDVKHAEAPTTGRGAMVAKSVMWLAALVADGFACDLILMASQVTRKTVVRFYGSGTGAEIAAYAFTVLRRQMDADRMKHTARIRKRINKVARGEEFALGWVTSVRRLFPAADMTEEKKATLQHAIALNHPHLETTSGRDLSRKGIATANDRDAGFLAGANASLRPGIRGADPVGLEHHA